jgi:hypothetical protein
MKGGERMSKLKVEENILQGGVFVTQIGDMYRLSLVPRACLDGVPNARERNKENDKTEQSLCRARNKIIELAYCNEWTYFFTATFDKEKVGDRTNRKDTLAKLVKWLQNKARTCGLKYLLIPEMHADGESLHAHGLLYFEELPDVIPFKDITDRTIPKKLKESEYLNWNDYEKKFGFCSLGEIRSKKAISFYLSKYITKGMKNAIKDFSAHVYYCSKGLLKGESVGGFHNHDANIDLMQTIPWAYKDTDKGIASLTVESHEELLAILKENRLELCHSKTIK